jgi:hypothetical protein
MQLLPCLATNVIVSGVVVSGSSITDGWVVYNGELIPVAGGSLQIMHLIQH